MARMVASVDGYRSDMCGRLTTRVRIGLSATGAISFAEDLPIGSWIADPIGTEENLGTAATSGRADWRGRLTNRPLTCRSRLASVVEPESIGDDGATTASGRQPLTMTGTRLGFAEG